MLVRVRRDLCARDPSAAQRLSVPAGWTSAAFFSAAITTALLSGDHAFGQTYRTPSLVVRDAIPISRRGSLTPRRRTEHVTGTFNSLRLAAFGLCPLFRNSLSGRHHRRGFRFERNACRRLQYGRKRGFCPALTADARVSPRRRSRRRHPAGEQFGVPPGWARTPLRDRDRWRGVAEHIRQLPVCRWRGRRRKRRRRSRSTLRVGTTVARAALRPTIACWLAAATWSAHLARGDRR